MRGFDRPRADPPGTGLAQVPVMPAALPSAAMGLALLVGLADVFRADPLAVEGLICPGLIRRATAPVQTPLRGRVVVALESEHASLTLSAAGGALVVVQTSADVLDQLTLGQEITIQSPAGPAWPTDETTPCRSAGPRQ
jgi:hypothetical protein